MRKIGGSQQIKLPLARPAERFFSKATPPTFRFARATWVLRPLMAENSFVIRPSKFEIEHCKTVIPAHVGIKIGAVRFWIPTFVGMTLIQPLSLLTRS